MSQRIITEADVKELEPHQQIVLDGNTIITPSAQDAAYTRGITIIDERPEKGTRFARGSNRQEPGLDDKQGLGKLTRLEDGDYLLQIRNGNPKLFEIRESGVFPVQGF